MPSTLGIVASGYASTTLTVSIISTTVSTSAGAYTIPAGTQAGDIAVFLDGGGTSFSSTPPTYVLPSGFTQILNTAVVGTFAALRAVGSYKILNASDISTGTITGMSPGTARKQLRIIRPSSTVTTITVSTPTSQSTAGDPAAQTISMAAVTPPVIGFAWGATTGGTVSVTSTPSVLSVTQNTGFQAIGNVVYNNSPQNITVDMNDPGENMFSSWWMQFS